MPEDLCEPPRCRRRPRGECQPLPTPSAPPVGGPVLARGAGRRLGRVAGQVGVDPDGALVAGGVEAEARQVLANVAAVLDDCGATWGDVARVGIFLTDLGSFAAVNALYEGAIGDPPARAHHGGRGGAARRARRWRSSAGRISARSISVTALAAVSRD